MLKVGIAIMFFGVLRRMEIMSVQIKDVETKDAINIEYPYRENAEPKDFDSRYPNG